MWGSDTHIGGIFYLPLGPISPFFICVSLIVFALDTRCSSLAKQLHSVGFAKSTIQWKLSMYQVGHQGKSNLKLAFSRDYCFFPRWTEYVLKYIKSLKSMIKCSPRCTHFLAFLLICRWGVISNEWCISWDWEWRWHKNTKVLVIGNSS